MAVGHAHGKRRTTNIPFTGTWTIPALARCALAGAAFALCLPAGAAADSSETTATVTIRPGPLALYGVPAATFFTPQVRYSAAVPSAALPPIRVVDATGSGRGWHLLASVASGSGAWIRTTVSSYNGPAQLSPRAAGDVRLAQRPRRVAFALRDQGMGTTVLRGVSVYALPGVRVCFVLESGPSTGPEQRPKAFATSSHSSLAAWPPLRPRETRRAISDGSSYPDLVERVLGLFESRGGGNPDAIMRFRP
jgi:hypothetical protein